MKTDFPISSPFGTYCRSKKSMDVTVEPTLAGRLEATCRTGGIPAVEALLAEGGPGAVELVGPESGKPPLWIACIYSHQELAFWLVLKAGAKQLQGVTLKKLRDPTSKNIFLPPGEAVSDGGNFGIYIASALPLFVGELNTATAVGDVMAVEQLLRQGAVRADDANSNGATALHSACAVGLVDVVRLLAREHGANAEAVKARKGMASLNDFCTPLIVAARYGHDDVCRVLLKECGADVDKARTDDGATPLYMAAAKGHTDVCRLLAKECGADVDKACTDDGATPLYIAAEKGHVDVCRSLAKECGADVDKARTTKDGGTALLVAAQSGHVDVCRLLAKECGADVDKATTDLGATPLYIAAYCGHVEVCRVLAKECGADVDKARTDDGTTPLYVAAWNGHVDVCRLLAKECGADVEKAQTNNFGWSPLTAAGVNDHLDVVRVLINECNATPKIVGLKGAQLPKARRHLARILRENLLLEDGTATPTQAKLLLCGFPGVGKTTLSKSLGRTKFQSKFTHESKPAERDKLDERTAGFEVARTTVPGAGDFAIYDFAGHSEYYMTHELFLVDAGAVFVVLCGLYCHPDRQCEHTLYWLRFIAARASGASSTSMPCVVLAGSGRDDAHPQSKVERRSDGPGWHAASGQAILAEMKTLFAGQLQLSNTFHVLDCRRSHGDGMTAFRTELGAYREAVLHRLPRIPQLCDATIKALPKFRKKHPGLIEVGIFADFVRAELANDSCTDAKIRALLGYLFDAGEVIFFGDDDPDRQNADTVVIDPQWFGTQVVGRVLAPDNFLLARPQIEEGGVIPTHELERVLGKTPPLKATISYLEALELCFSANEAKTAYVFPATLRHDMPPELWPKGSTDADCSAKIVHLGIRLQCANSWSMISPGFFPRLQTRAQSTMGQPCPVWNGGTLCTQDQVQCLIELAPSREYIDLVARVAVDDAGELRVLCRKLLHKLEQTVHDVRSEISPDQQLTRLALGVHSLGDGRPMSARDVFGTIEELQVRAARGEHTHAAHPSTGATELLLDLLEAGGQAAEPEIRILDSDAPQGMRRASDGAVGSPRQVTLICATKGATIRYTLDGSDPTVASTAHAAGNILSVLGVVQDLKATAYKDGMAPSPVASVSMKASARAPPPLIEARAQFVSALHPLRR